MDTYALTRYRPRATKGPERRNQKEDQWPSPAKEAWEASRSTSPDDLLIDNWPHSPQ